MSVAELSKDGNRAPRPRRVVYPTGDGKPMAETVEHREAMTYAIEAASIALSHLPEVWINGNDFVYYEEGNPRKRVSPDCYIVLGVPRGDRPFFKIWEERGRTPNLVIEFTSKDTAREDRETKFDLYQNVLKVPEYFLFDPLNHYLRPRFQGYRLVNGHYQAISPDDQGRLRSAETGIVMYPEGKLLRFIHPLTGETIMTRSEAEEQRLAQQFRAEAAEAELARLKAELERLRQSARSTENVSNGNL